MTLKALFDKCREEQIYFVLGTEVGSDQPTMTLRKVFPQGKVGSELVHLTETILLKDEFIDEAFNNALKRLSKHYK